MGSSRSRKSARVGKARSITSTSNHRRTPASSFETLKQKERALREGIKRFRAADRLSRDAVHEHTETDQHDELRGIRQRLELAHSVALVVGTALAHQNDGLDSDAARILGRHVSDPLHIQMMRLDRLLGQKVDQDDIEEENE